MAEKLREIRVLVEPQSTLEGDGVKLKRSIATRALDYLDPFLLLDHFGSDDPEDYLRGFPMHPHRGIETVTYLLEGEVRHEDSLGNGGIIGPGDVQWMTAGGGIMHEEMPRPRDGRMEGFQLWVNLPARLKMSPPRYRGIEADAIPLINLESGGKCRLIAGELGGVQGPVGEISVDPTYLDVSLPADAVFRRAVPRGQSACAYLFQGQAHFACPGEGKARRVDATKLVVFGDGDRVELIAGEGGARFLYMSAAPLGEPVARYGPFVMNTREEIEQALRDLRDDTFIYRESR